MSFLFALVVSYRVLALGLAEFPYQSRREVAFVIWLPSGGSLFEMTNSPLEPL